MTRVASSWIAAFVAVAALAAPAEAQGVEADAEARQRFEEGRVAYDAGDIARAESLWSDAFRLSGRCALLVNIGRVRERLGDVPGAVSAYRHYLEIAGADASERATVSERLSALDPGALDGAVDRGEPSPSSGGDPFAGWIGTWIAGGATVAALAVGTGLAADGGARGDAGSADAGNALLGTAALAAVVTVVVWFVEDHSHAPAPEHVASGSTSAAAAPALVRF